MDAFCLLFRMVPRSLTFRRKIWCCWRRRGNAKRLNLRQFKLLCLSPLNRLQFHRWNSQTMATRQKAVYTNIFLLAVHLFTRLTFLENCVPFFSIVPCVPYPEWVASTYLWKLLVMWSCEKSSNLVKQRVALLPLESWIVSIAELRWRVCVTKSDKWEVNTNPKPVQK